MLKFVINLLEIVNWITLPLVVMGDFFALAAVGNNGDTDLLTVIAVIIAIIYPVLIVLGIDKASKYYDNGQLWVSLAINLFLASPSILLAIYLIASYYGYRII